MDWMITLYTALIKSDVYFNLPLILIVADGQLEDTDFSDFAQVELELVEIGTRVTTEVIKEEIQTEEVSE